MCEEKSNLRFIHAFPGTYCVKRTEPTPLKAFQIIFGIFYDKFQEKLHKTEIWLLLAHTRCTVQILFGIKNFNI